MSEKQRNSEVRNRLRLEAISSYFIRFYLNITPRHGGKETPPAFPLHNDHAATFFCYQLTTLMYYAVLLVPMEFARTMFCSSPPFPPRTHPWNTHPPSSSTSGAPVITQLLLQFSSLFVYLYLVPCFVFPNFTWRYVV